MTNTTVLHEARSVLNDSHFSSQMTLGLLNESHFSEQKMFELLNEMRNVLLFPVGGSLGYAFYSAKAKKLKEFKDKRYLKLLEKLPEEYYIIPSHRTKSFKLTK